MQNTVDNSIVYSSATIPYSPPPSYEHVLEETRLERSNSTDEDEGEQAKVQNGKSTKEKTIDRGYTERQPVLGPEILHKSSKELYKAVAKQWGITCKMSDHCRCFDCQSRYFDCEYEKDGQGTDGGLGAGTPMFISELMHGTTCSLL